MTPWSVSPSAGWPNEAARAARASILHAPASSEYSEWTWRCAQDGVLTGRIRIGAGADGSGGFPMSFSALWRLLASVPAQAPREATQGAIAPARGGAGRGLDGARGLLAQPVGGRVQRGELRGARLAGGLFGADRTLARALQRLELGAQRGLGLARAVTLGGQRRTGLLHP